MAIDGELVVRLETDAGRVTHASARAERPRLAARLFTGRRAAEAPALAGALYAICARSQAAAAEAAVEAAQGEGEDAARRDARDARIAAETIHEHAWRLLVDWPRLAGRAPEVARLAQGRSRLAPRLAARPGAALDAARDETVAWAREALFGVSPREFLAVESLEALHRWLASAETPAAALARLVLAERAALGAGDVEYLPPAAPTWIARGLAPALDADPGFDDRPHWQGGARETGALARTAGHPLVAAAVGAWGRGVGARLVARLVETAAALEAFGGRHGAVDLGEGSAIAWAETARGLLVHRVGVEDGRIAGYRIVAPTEWNFHPDGAFARGVRGLAAADEAGAEAAVRWIVASLDPCVAVRFEAGHA